MTKPHSTFKEKLLRHGCEIAFHADITSDERKFISDLEYIFGKNNPFGFSKHGSIKNELEAKKKGCEVYDPDRCIYLAKKYGFTYFSGNGVNPEEPWRITDGIVYFPSAFWMSPTYMNKKYTLKWLIKNYKDKDIVVLIHPREYTDVFPKTKNLIDKLLNKVDEIMSFYNFIRMNILSK